jgi:Integrase zinc binding domain/RNase H-like domain found in reverse transcriptase
MAGGLATEANARAISPITTASLAYSQVQSPKVAVIDESPLRLSISKRSPTIVPGAPPVYIPIASQFIECASQNQAQFSTYAPAHIATFIGLRPRMAINDVFPAYLTSFGHSLSLTIAKSPQSNLEAIPMLISAKKKYKPVARKVKPVLEDLPAKFRIIRNIIGDPLASLPVLNPHPPPYAPTGRYTQERKDQFDKDNSHFLLPDERALLHHFMMLHNEAFAWDNAERGHFREDFFPPIDIPVIPHEPWVERNIRIPPGLYDELCKLVKQKIDAGVFEPSNSSYRSRWFCVLKKDGKSLRIVQSLEPLNKVTIAHSGVPPFTEQLAEQFAGRACNSMMDLYVGYDERALAESSRDLTTFQTPYGAMRLTTLPMGWTNSVPIFHDDVTHILQQEIPHVTQPYIDDVPVKGPATMYIQDNGEPETIPENPGIRRFVWEHFQDLNRVVQRMKYSGGTFSGYKSTLCAPEITVLGHRCTAEGRLPDPSRVAKIVNWGPCKDLTDVRAFVGTIGVCRLFIKNFAHRAHHLVKLTRKGAPWEFGPEQLSAMDDLKRALLESPSLRPIDYRSDVPVILSVDTSYIAVGFILSQCDPVNPRLRYHARFGSITLNDRERRFSQPKLELYGLYRALRTLKLYLIGIRNLIIEVDAKYIKGMLQNPDIAPSASINRWIVSILMFHFTLVHVPGTHHGPDGLSRRRPQPGDEEEPQDDFEDWIDNVNGFLHFLNPHPRNFHCLTATPPVAAYITDVSEQQAERAPPETPQDAPVTPYSIVPRSESAISADLRLDKVQKWLETLNRPEAMADTEYKTFMRYCTEFAVISGTLWRKDPKGRHKKVVPQARRLFLITVAHDDVGHHGVYATTALLTERYWWPHMTQDIAWFILTCHICQVRKTKQSLIPPVVDVPAPLFSKVYMDTMHMPPSSGYKYIVQGRCSLIYWPEWARLQRENSKSLGEWILHDFIFRWGLLLEIVTDNGPAFLKALAYLEKRYHIKHIRISGYNSRANGLVERSHFEVREALFKACDGDQSKWSSVADSVFWAERVTIRRRMGCSPYFAATGTHPILPIDIAEANYLLPPPEAPLTSTDLIARRAITLQKRRAQLTSLQAKVYAARVQAAVRFEKEHANTIKDFDFKLGDLVLVRNTAIEKSLNRKMRARYLGPLIVLARNKGGAYIVAELDGSVFDRPAAAFRVIPYFARTHIDLPPLHELLDISNQRFQELRDSEISDPDDEDNDNIGEDPPV